MKEYVNCSDDLKKALEINNETSEVYYFMAYVNINLKNFETALKDLNNAIRLGLELCRSISSKRYCKSKFGRFRWGC